MNDSDDDDSTTPGGHDINGDEDDDDDDEDSLNFDVSQSPSEEDGRVFVCSESSCGRSFSSKFKMMRHMLIHSGERQFQCSLCNRCFHRKDHLKNHLQVHNPNKVVHSCHHCCKKYSSLLSYRKHLALHAAESGDLSCKLCGKVFQVKEQVMYHLKVHSGSRALKGPNERKFKCDQCERSFFTRKDVKRHMVVHTGVRNFLCQFCPQRFGRKDHLVRHIKKSHAGQAMNHNNNNTPKDSVNKNDQHHHHNHHHHHPTQTNEKPVLPRPQSMSSATPDHTSSFSAFQPSGLMPVLQESCPTYITMKQDSCFPPTSLMENPSSCTSSLATLTASEESDHMGMSVMPLSQYFPFSSSMPHLLPGNCYLTGVPTCSASSLLPGLPSDSILSTLSAPIPFSAPMPLDVGASSLPHFSQAFQ